MNTTKLWPAYVMAMMCAILTGLSNIAVAAVLEPYNVTVSYVASQNKATISWVSDAPAAYGFDVQRRVAGGTLWSNVGYVSDPARTRIDLTLAPLTRYVYRVVAYRPGGPTVGYTSTSMAATNLDFPYGVAYPNGISPNNYTQAQKDADVQTMYTKWRSVYLTSVGAGTGGMRVHKPSEASESVSEGIGYGMLISAYIANSSNTGKADFDGLLKYYKSKFKIVGTTNYGLMAWRIASNGTIIDNYIAPDGDIDAAYALLVADKKWGSFGAINYKQEAVNIMTNLMKWVVLNRGASDSNLMYRGEMTLGRVESATDYTMSSYQIVSYFKQFKTASADGRWDNVLRAGYKFHDYFHEANPSTGLTPFTFLTQPGANQYQQGVRGYNYGYDASRLPWRVGMDYMWYGNANSTFANASNASINPNLAQQMPSRNAKWFQTATSGNPQSAKVSYELWGSPSSGSYNGGQRSMGSAMAVGAMTDSTNQAWLNTMYGWMRVQSPGQNSVSGGVTITPEYYADTVMMVCMLAVTGNMPNLPAVPAP